MPSQALIFITGVSASAVAGLVFGTPLGQAEATPAAAGDAFFKYIFGGGSVAVLGALAFYLAVYVLPKTYDKHAEAIKLLAEAHSKMLETMGQRHATTIESLVSRFDGWEKVRHEDATRTNETLRTIITHCAKQGAT
jgi:hypothetical protein